MAKLRFDKLRWQMNIADMAQESLALLMMIRWFRFARFDVSEDRRTADVLDPLVATAIAYLILDQVQQTAPTSLTPRIPGDFISPFPGTARAQLLLSLLIWASAAKPATFFRELHLRIQTSSKHSQDGLS